MGEPISEKSSFQMVIEKPDSKIAVVREKKDKQNLAKAKAKCTGEGNLAVPRTISITPFHHAATKPADETVSSIPKNTTWDAVVGPQTANLEKEVVNLSENTHGPTPQITVVQPSLHAGHGATQEQVVACKEMITHLVTPAKEEFLSGLTNVEVVRRAYQLLGRCVLSQGELLKRHEQLNSEHVDLHNRSDIQLEELTRLRTDIQRQMQTYDGLSKRFILLDSAYSSYEDKERELLDQLKDMEKERDD
ncbi:hypothetical protein Tco_0144703 [Tanacetum coccineum]